MSLSLSYRRRDFGVTELWRSHVSGCAYICSVYMELIDVSESLLFQFVVESSATSCDVVPRLLKQLSFVCFSVFSPKPRVKGRGSPVETSAKQKRRPSRQARPSPSASAKNKTLANGFVEPNVSAFIFIVYLIIIYLLCNKCKSAYSNYTHANFNNQSNNYYKCRYYKAVNHRAYTGFFKT